VPFHEILYDIFLLKMNFLAAERTRCCAARGIAGKLSESAAEADAQGLRGVFDPATKFL